MLRVPELLLIVAEYIKFDLTNEDRERDLLSFILSCKTFLDPGLDVKFHSLHGLDHIMRIFPDGMVTRTLETEQTAPAGSAPEVSLR